MVNTETSRYMSSYPILVNESDLVYDGKITIDANAKWYDLKLDNEFAYTGNNVLLCVYDYTGTDTGKYTTFNTYNAKVQDSEGNNIIRSVYKRASGSFDPTLESTSKTTFSSGGSLPQVKFKYSSGGSAETPTPDKPTLNLPYDNTTNLINPLLRFTLGQNTTHYQIFLGESEQNLTAITDVIAKTTDEVDFQTNGLNSGTQYFWKVVATNDKNDDPKTAESDIYNFTTKAITSVPETISNISPTNGATDLVNPVLSWEFGLNTEEYQVLLDGNIKIDWTLCTTTTGSYQTSGLSSGEHTWQVNARNSAGTTEGTVYTFSVASLPDNVTPISPADGATGVTSNIIKFQFAKGTENYRVLYDRGYGFEYVNGNGWVETNNATTTGEFTLPEFVTGKTYYWAVDVKNDLGQRSVHEGGEEIAIYSFTTSSISAPEYTSPSIFEGTEATLTWQYQEGEITEYQVLLGTDSENLEVAKDWTAIEGTSGSYTHSGLTENVKYYWQVNVRNNNESANGNVESFISLKKPSFVNNVINVYPGSNTEASANIQFNGIPSLIGADSYNIYVDGSLLKENLASNLYTLNGINYNSGNPYVVKATAVYSEFGESLGSDINVYVSGCASVAGTVKGKLGNAIEGATIQYVGTTALEADVEKTFTFTTDANGQYSGNLPCGTYSATVSANKYEGATIAEKTFNYNDNITENVTLTPIIPGNVTNVSPENNAENVSNVATLSWNFATNTNTTHYRVVVNETYRTGWIPTEGATSASFETSSLGLNANATVNWCIDVKNEMGARTYYPNGDATTITTNIDVHTYKVSNVVAAEYTSPKHNTIINSNVVTLEWNYGQNNGAEQYRVLLNKDGEELADVTGWVNIETEGTGFVSTGSWTSGLLTPTTKYNWRVDVKKGETIVEGNVSSFITPLAIPTNLTAENDKVYPTEETNYEKGIVKFSWTGVDGAIGYNVYRDGEYVNPFGDPTSTTESNFELLLAPRLDSDYEIQVTAVYDLGESEKTEAITAKVMGYATVKGTIINENSEKLENATVTFTGVDAFGTEQTITFTTNAYGAYNGLIPQGTYTMTVSCTDYSDYTKENIKVDYNGTYTQSATLYTRHLFDVLIRQDKDVKFNSIDIRLTNDNWDLNANYAGTYHVYYQKDGGEILSVPSHFSIDYQPTLLLAGDAQFRTIWTGLPNGEYRIGVSTKNDGTGVNWCNNTITRDYCIFANDGRWEDVENWSNGEMPKVGGSAFIYAHATINSEIVAGTITIERKGTDGKSSTLTINKGGALIATDVINTANFACFIINDGGQLRRTNPDKNYELNGKFVMNITNPEDWTEENKTGWQLISVPFSAEADISEFTGVNDSYDFYKFDGNNQGKEWINFKNNTNDLETSFVNGRGYLASYKERETFAPTGVFNSSSSHDFVITTGDKRMSGFQLLGNPFSFNMEWSKVEHSGLVDGFAVANDKGTYDYHDGSDGTISVGDGFFVKAIEENATMSYDANSANSISRSEKTESINVIASGNNGNDNVIISFAGANKEGFPKLDNFNDKVANIFVNNNDVRYGIFNYDRNTTEVEVSFIASVMGRYTISMKTNGEFDNLVLVDRFTGIETNMLLEDYSFTASGQQDHNRFVVRLSMNNNDIQKERFVYQSNNELIINGEGLVQIIDIMGRIVYTNEINGISRVNVSNFYSATYVVKVVNENEVKTQKVVIY
ncbi:MAG: carboxypeptidase regulatory-like domain-containing protein [Bacteroidales bacterium]|nr:carboxypeptidase regulatory-like domain-containing protein [Bacteroidales bacterium]